MDAAEETICRAISHRRRLAFLCGDEMCVAEPHRLGRDAAGHLVLLAYLVEGGRARAGKPASSGNAGGDGEGWRVYRVADFYWALESSEPFDGPRPGFERWAEGEVRTTVCQL